jgi:hypothetical protein
MALLAGQMQQLELLLPLVAVGIAAEVLAVYAGPAAAGQCCQHNLGVAGAVSLQLLDSNVGSCW